MPELHWATNRSSSTPPRGIGYAELDATTRELAAGFLSAGVAKGSRVGLIMPNGVRWAQIALALTRIGAVLVPLSTLLTGPELIAQLRVASVRYLIAVAEFRGHHYLDDLHSHMAKLSALQTIWRADELPAPGDATVVDAVADTVVPADPLLVMFTSGSSGTPKGDPLARQRIGRRAGWLSARRIDVDTRLYVPMPFFWVGDSVPGC